MSSPERGFRGLVAWQRAVDLAVGSLALCSRIPRSERTGIVGQLRRSATSVSLNIAEGHGRAHNAEYLHSLYFARGSLQESETMLEIVLRAGLVRTELVSDVLKTADETGRVLAGLIKRVRDTSITHSKPQSQPSSAIVAKRSALARGPLVPVDTSNGII